MEIRKLPSGLYAVIINGQIDIYTEEELKKLQSMNKYLQWWNTVKHKYFKK